MLFCITKRHECWHTVGDMCLIKCSIIIIVLLQHATCGRSSCVVCSYPLFSIHASILLNILILVKSIGLCFLCKKTFILILAIVVFTLHIVVTVTIYVCICIYIYIYINSDSYIYIYIISRRSITPQHIKYNSKSLDVVQYLYFGSKLPSSGTYNMECTFLTKAACCRNIEIVLHPTTLSYIYIHIVIFHIRMSLFESTLLSYICIYIIFRSYLHS